MIICIGELAKYMAEGAASFNHCADLITDTSSDIKVYHFETKGDFFKEAASLFQKGDTVLVKASHGMEFPEIVEYLKKLSLAGSIR